jgi:hypothetical protein
MTELPLPLSRRSAWMNAGAPGIFSRRSQQDRLWNEVFSLSFLGNLSDFINSARKDRKFRLFFSKVTS